MPHLCVRKLPTWTHFMEVLVAIPSDKVRIELHFVQIMKTLCQWL